MTQQTLTPDEIKGLISFYEQLLNTLAEENTDVLQKYNHYNDKLSHYRSLLSIELPVIPALPATPKIVVEDYPIKGNALQKITYILNNNPNKFLSATQIVDLMIPYEGKNVNPLLHHNIQNGLYYGCKRGILLRSTGPDSKYIYKLAEEVLGEYPINGTWNEKIQYLMKKKGEGLTSNDVVDEIAKIEKKRKRKQLLSSVTASLSAGVTSGKYKKIKIVGENRFIYSI